MKNVIVVSPYLFSKMKDQLKGYQFKDATDVQIALANGAGDHIQWLPEMF
jgi:hypothetical protein